MPRVSGTTGATGAGAGSVLNAEIAYAVAAAVSAKAVTITAARRATSRRGSSIGGAGRRCASDQSSGESSRSRTCRERFTSRIVVLQECAEPPPAFAEMHVHGRSGDAHHRGHLGGGPVGVVVEHDGHPLVRREPSERGDQVVDRLRELVNGGLVRCGFVAMAPLQLARGDPERSLPDPSVGGINPSPRASAWANASATASLAMAGSPLNPTRARHRRADSRS